MKYGNWKKRIILWILVVAMVISCTFAVAAIGWNGEGTSGGGATSNQSGDYSIMGSTATKCVVGYRFSGGLASDPTQRPNNKIRSIDVMIDSSILSKRAKMNPQFTKVDYFLMAFDGDKSLSEPAYPEKMASESGTGYNDTTYNESDLEFKTSLPGKSSSNLATALNTWQANDENLDVIATLLGWSGLDGMATNDCIYIEPLYALEIDGEKLVLTPSEIVWIGGLMYGWDFNGKNKSVGTDADSWGYIGTNFTHKNFPNLIYASSSTGSVGWTVQSSALTSNATSAYMLPCSILHCSIRNARLSSLPSISEQSR